MKKIAPNIIRQVFVLLLILAMGSLIFQEMLPYFGGALGAVTLHVIFRNWMEKLTDKGWHKPLAASLLILLSVIGILIPIVGLGLLMNSKIQYITSNSEQVINAIKEQIEKVESYFGYDLTSSQIDTSKTSTWITDMLQSFAGGTLTIVIAIAVMYFLLYFMLVDRKSMLTSLYEYIPLKEGNLETLGKETRSKVLANAIGIPLVALGQGIVGLIGFLIFGIPDPFFWAAVVTIGSMIPFVGSALGTIPVFILALSNGNTFQAWAILIYGTVAIGATDNLFRLYILQRLDDIHPLITLIGVLVGVPLFGFIGLIFGPLLVSLFLILVKIYKDECGSSRSKL